MDFLTELFGSEKGEFILHKKVRSFIKNNFGYRQMKK